MKSSSCLTWLLAMSLLVSGCGSKEEEAADSVAGDTLAAGEIADSTGIAQPDDTLQLFEDLPLPETADELFDDFYFNFATNREFQKQRMAQRLTLREDGVRQEVDAASWNADHAFPSTELYCVIFERNDELELEKDTTLRHVDIEVAHLEEKVIETFHFNKGSRQWTLTEIEREPFADSPNGDFLDFYARFTTDSAFQNQRLVDPIPFVLTNQGEAGEGGMEQMSAEEWAEQDMPLPAGQLVNIVYGQSYLSKTRKSMQVRDMGGVILRYNFEKGPSGWKLVSIEQ